MICQEFQEKLLEFDDLIQAESEDWCSEHLSECGSCRHFLSYEKQLREGFQEISQRPVPTQVANAIQQIPKPKVVKAFWQKPWISWSLSFSLAGAFFFLLFLRPTGIHKDPAARGGKAGSHAQTDLSARQDAAGEPTEGNLQNGKIFANRGTNESEAQPSSEALDEKDVLSQASSSQENFPEKTFQIAKLPQTSSPDRESTKNSSLDGAIAFSIDNEETDVLRESKSPADGFRPAAGRPGTKSKGAAKISRVSGGKADAAKAFEIARLPEEEASQDSPPPRVRAEPLIESSPKPPSPIRMQLARATSKNEGKESKARTYLRGDEVQSSESSKALDFESALYAPTSTRSGFSQNPQPSFQERKKAESRMEFAALPSEKLSHGEADKSAGSGVTEDRDYQIAFFEAIGTRDLRHEKIEAVLKKYPEARVQGPIDINGWVVSGWITVKERIELAPGYNSRWIAKKRKDRWEVFLSPAKAAGY